MFGINKLFRKPTCPHSATIYTDFTKAVIRSEENCIYDKNHKGPHRDRLGNVWATQDRLAERLEWNGLK